MIEKGETIRRGDFIVTEVKDTTRVAHPKTADIIELDGEFLVVPVARVNSIQRRDTFGEAMDYVARYVGASE